MVAVSDTTITSNNASCTNSEFLLTRAVGPDCTPFASLNWDNEILDASGNPVLFDVNGLPIDFDSNVIQTTLLAGTYVINWNVSDGCGNSAGDTQNLTILNTKLPVPVCLNSLAVSLDLNGQVVLSAAELDAGSYHPCGVQLGITVSFNASGTQPSMAITCDPLATYPLSLPVNLYVIDNLTGLGDFCTANIQVQDPLSACGPPVMMVTVSGEVKTEMLQSIEEVKVELGATEPFEITDAEGLFAFKNMPIGGDYVVSPSKDDDHLNGVSTLDLVRIQRHILGIEQLDSPYKLIAADVNDNQVIDGVDLVELRKLILGIYTELPENDSWRFVDATYKFVDVLNPWAEYIEESRYIDNLGSDMAVDFVGVKIGDVDGTAITSDLRDQIDMRSFRWPLTFELPEIRAKKGDLVTIPVYSSNYERVSGWQMTLGFDNSEVEIVEIVGRALEMGAANYHINSLEGWMTVSYGTQVTQNFDSEEALFELRLRAKKDMTTEDFLQVTSQVTQAEAYRGYNEIVDVKLDQRASTQASINSVNPNPWITSTDIEFTMPAKGKGSWEFYDVDGRILHRLSDDYEQGLQVLRLNREEIAGTGIIYIRLTTDKGVAESRMIIVE